MDTRWCVGVLIVASLAVANVTFTARTNIPALRVTGVCKAKMKTEWSPLNKLFHVELPLSCFDTGLATRNEHMLKDLGAANHPFATMKYTLSEDKSTFQGTLFLNGVSRPVSGSLLQSPERYFFRVLLSDFNIPASSRFGIKIQNEVEVTAEL
jgi:hypothetical protein